MLYWNTLFNKQRITMATEKQGEILTDLLILTELWLSKIHELIDSGYTPRKELKFHGQNFKKSLENLQKELFNNAKSQLPESEYSEFEKKYMDKTGEIELLIQEYLRGKVTVIND